jgi:cytochrome b involved in lipid metabolism
MYPYNSEFIANLDFPFILFKDYVYDITSLINGTHPAGSSII